VPALLRERAQQLPDRIGYTFLIDGETEEAHLTYGQLHGRANAVAAAVRAAGGVPGGRVLLVFPPGLEFVAAFYGCLAAGGVAVPVYPPDPLALDRTLPRLLAVVRDAAPTVALTTAPLLGHLDQLLEVAPALGQLRWVAVDTVPDAGDAGPSPVSPDTVAVLQYTSGSTAMPRGVVLTHRNLLHNSHLIQQVFGTTDDTRGLSWLPPYHDMGLVGGVLQPLFAGCPVTLMSPLHFLEQPMRWLRAIDHCGVTASGGPNFAYELCVRAAEQAPPDGLDLSRWRVAFNGAEPIRAETLRRFADAFAPAGFRPDAALPCYGLAEATLIVSGTSRWAGAARAEVAVEPPVVTVDRDALQRHVAAAPAGGPVVELTSCGRGAADQRIVIVDPATSSTLPPGHVGEIWVSGPSVAQGYWGRPEETEQVFRARTSDRDQGPFLRTGDLGFLNDEELVVTGRIKDLLIIRGRNHYPQDIEFTAERADPALRRGSAVAFLADDDDPEAHLVVVLELRRHVEGVDVVEVTARVRRAVAAELGLEVRTVVLVRAGGVPKTSSGKIQRWRCREWFLAGRLAEVSRLEAAASPAGFTAAPNADDVLAADPARRPAMLAEYVRGQVAWLGGVDAGDLDPGQPLLAAGLDSLSLTRLRGRMEAELGVAPPLAELLGGASLAEIVERLAPRIDLVGPRRPDGLTGTGSARTEYTAPLSVAQQWMWLQDQLDPGSSAFTVPVTLRLLDVVDHDALRRAVDTVVVRHPILRTTFTLHDGAPAQVVHPTGRAAFGEHDVRHLDPDRLTRRLARDARRPFDLERGPLLRLDLYQHPDGEVLQLTVHHIITDFWSMNVLAREIAEAYTAHAGGRQQAYPDEPARASFADVVAWQSRLLADPATAQPLTRYWDEQVGDGVPGLGLPVVQAGRGVDGGSRAFALSAASTDRLRSRAAAEKVTVHVLLLATVQALLHGLTGTTDLAVGTSAGGRTREELAEVMGCCTNPVMIRDRITGDEPFRALLARTRAGVIAALEHQDYPTILLGKRHRVANHGRLIEALFTFNRSPDGDDLAAAVFLGVPGVRRRLGTLHVETVALEPGQSTRALELGMAEVGGRLHGRLRYAPGALNSETAGRFVDHFVAALDHIAEDPGVTIDDLAAAGPHFLRRPDATARA
jgi:acyl-CoA synthetase (AMP-forming)/AMP-acid ligase II